MTNKALGVELRKAGLSYPKIAKELDCSVAWCKKHLKDVEKNVDEKEAIKAVVAMAKSKAGVTSSEIRMKVRDVYPNDFSKDAKEREDKAVKRFKEKLDKTRGELVRPHWLIPEKARAVHHLVLEAAHSLTERLEEEVLYIREQLEIDSKYTKSLRTAIHDLTLEGSKHLFQPLEQHCERLLDCVNELERRNPVVKNPRRNYGYDAYNISETEVPY